MVSGRVGILKLNLKKSPPMTDDMMNLRLLVEKCAGADLLSQKADGQKVGRPTVGLIARRRRRQPKGSTLCYINHAASAVAVAID